MDASGNFTFGSSAHIALSNGTPSLVSGGGSGSSISGTDYAFQVLIGTGPGTTALTINFGHTFSNAPVAIATNGVLTYSVHISSTSTGNMVIQQDNGVGGWTAGDVVQVIVHGF